jgi:hypothetical protein
MSLAHELMKRKDAEKNLETAYEPLLNELARFVGQGH